MFILKNKLLAKLKKLIIFILVIAIAGGGGYFAYTKFVAKGYAQTSAKVETATVKRDKIDVTISGTGTVEPISRYDIVPLVKGKILSAPFEEGDSVKEGDLLYTIDDSDLSYNIQKAENSIKKLEISNQSTLDTINNLKVYAPADGKLTDFTLKEGERVEDNGVIAGIVNDKELIATVPFNKTQLQSIQVGQKAQLVLDDYMLYVDGAVSWISSTPSGTDEGAVLYNVEISIDNPGAILEDTEVTAIIKGTNGDIMSPDSGTVGYSKEQSVLARASGKVKEVFVKDEEWVKAGQLILTLENDDLNDTVKSNTLEMKDSQLSLNAQKKELEDYNILSPITGTVISKEYKAGDTIGNSSDSTTLMTVADLTKMIFTIDVDELDIAKVSVGQKVMVTADALSGENFEGEVTNIALEGESENGVTTYPVEVTISAPGKLKPGMNVNAEIQVESKESVLLIPVSAITTENGKSYVYVMSNTANMGQMNEQSGQQNKQDSPPDNPQSNKNNSGTMAGRQRVEVTTGISNDNYIEIVSGLNEGDIVYVPTTSTSEETSTKQQGMPGGGPGGMMGGPPPG